jgi:two-component system NtrC family sensor kinase
VIGALGLGIRETPFARSFQLIVIFFMVMLAVTVVTVLVTLLFAAKATLSPIAAIAAMTRKVIGGDLTARVGLRPSGEMGVLCSSIDRMADAIAQREKLLHERARQQIGQSEKLASIGRLAAGIAHEINNPLTGVLTFAHLLKGKPGMGDEDRHDLDVIIHETTRVREIVRGLLDFARQSPPAKEMLDLNGVIRLTMKLIRSQKEFGKVRIEEGLDPRLPPVLGDRNQLQQVFLNLSLNACEAMPVGGTLSIVTSADEDGVKVVIRDTGTGIKKEHIDKIFNPFFTTKPVGKGTGLGLSVSLGTIEAHDGSIEVESAEGKGTAFTIRLPITAHGRESSQHGHGP